ncbi:MAG: CinA family protein [Metamycoplasmataceae bacterium]
MIKKKIKKKNNIILKSNYSISSIESFTGGLFAAKMIENQGASNWFKGSLVLYQNEAKNLFKIDTSNGVINKEMALQMINVGLNQFKTDICISFTGNAGPDNLENKPIGLVYIGINQEVFEYFLKGTRNEIRNEAVEIAISLLISKKILIEN